jgi:NADH-ubiquinone oxidoreductase chain 4L
MMGINLHIFFIIMIKICKLIKIKGSYYKHLCYNLRPYFLNYLDKEKDTMNLSLILFLIGILGFVLNRKNIILMLISIEIMLLAITFLILISSLSFDDILGQTYAIYIIAIAGAESAIGLGILVAFYRLRGSISIEYK